MKMLSRYLIALLAAAFVGLLFFQYWGIGAKRNSTQHQGQGQLSDSTSEARVPPTKPNHSALEPEGPANRFLITSDGMTGIPVRYQLPGVEHVHTASSYKDWVALFPADKQQRIQAFADRYHGVYDIKSPYQIAWMAQRGYPMPEDIIIAEGLNDEMLAQLAKQGNDKAAFLLHERFVDNAAGSVVNPNISTSHESNIAALSAANDDALLRSSSPFKGYIEASDAFKLYSDPLRQKANLISGLLRASTLGDTRADQVLNDYTGYGMISDAEYVIATQVAIDRDIDRNLIPGVKCPEAADLGFIPNK